MRRDTSIQLAAACVLLGALTSSTLLALHLTSVAGRARLSYTDRAEDGDRWEVALGVAMGAFRGLFVNALWMRANEMKEQGKYYESVELARAITRLQPRFPRVWAFHAWNLAYNISVMTQTREERWNWVQQGIRIMREEGIPANPKDLLLHKELAWIYLHKIGGFTDDANPFYKRMIAREWTVVMGPPPKPDASDRSRDKAIEKFAAWVQQYADAATTMGELAERSPAAAQLAERLKAEIAADLDSRDGRREFLERYEMTAALDSSTRREFYVSQSGPKTKLVLALIEDPALKDAWPQLLAHVRRRVLVEDYKMEPDRMVRFTRKYGPIDWRHHAAHSLYWSARGVEEALQVVRDDTRPDFDFLNTDRIVAQSIQDLFRSGELYFDFKASVLGDYTFWQGVPNPHFIQAYGELLDDFRKRSWQWDPKNKRYVRIDGQDAARGFSPLSDAYENFLIDATLFFYRRGQRDLAEEYLAKIRVFKDMNLSDPDRASRFTNLDEFAYNELVKDDRFTSPSVAINQVSASLMNAFASGLLGGDDDTFRGQMNWAASAHRFFFQEQARRTQSDRTMFRQEQMPRDFAFMAGTLFFQFMGSLDRESQELAYARAQPELRRYVYDELVRAIKPAVEAEQALGAKPFETLFPEPEGMDAHRAFLERYTRELGGTQNPIERK
jgi:hypothetical protein